MSSIESTSRCYPWLHSKSCPSCPRSLAEPTASSLKGEKLSWSGRVASLLQWILVCLHTIYRLPLSHLYKIIPFYKFYVQLEFRNPWQCTYIFVSIIYAFFCERVVMTYGDDPPLNKSPLYFLGISYIRYNDIFLSNQLLPIFMYIFYTFRLCRTNRVTRQSQVNVPTYLHDCSRLYAYSWNHTVWRRIR